MNGILIYQAFIVFLIMMAAVFGTLATVEVIEYAARKRKKSKDHKPEYQKRDEIWKAPEASRGNSHAQGWEVETKGKEVGDGK